MLEAEKGEQIYRGVSSALLPSPAPIAGTLQIEAEVHSQGVTYVYNDRDELIEVNREGFTSERYAYDAAGNRSEDHRAQDYLHNELDQLLSARGITYAYDANGNRIQKTDASGTTYYTYDAESRLLRIDFPDSGFAEYAYDALGRRTQKRNPGSTTTARGIMIPTSAASSPATPSGLRAGIRICIGMSATTRLTGPIQMACSFMIQVILMDHSMIYPEVAWVAVDLKVPTWRKEVGYLGSGQEIRGQSSGANEMASLPQRQKRDFIRENELPRRKRRGI